MTLEQLRDGRLRDPERIASFVLGMCRMVVLEIRRGTWRHQTLLETYGDTAEAVEPPEPLRSTRTSPPHVWRRLRSAIAPWWC